MTVFFIFIIFVFFFVYFYVLVCVSTMYPLICDASTESAPNAHVSYTGFQIKNYKIGKNRCLVFLIGSCFVV